MVDSTIAGPTVTCTRCKWVHSVPNYGPVSARAVSTRQAWVVPVASSSFGIALVVVSLVWALLGGGFGVGVGIGGEGMGPLAAGSGSGTGLSGEGGGAGTDGWGTGGDPPSQGPTADTSSPARNTQTPQEPATVSRQNVNKGFDDLTIDTPSPPAPPRNPHVEGDPGREGAAGDGATGKAGKDPGARGDVSFTLTWTYSQNVQGADRRGGPDVDIWVTDPLGQRINTSEERPIRKGPTPEGGRADFDDRGAHGDGNGGGPERVFWPKGKAPVGDYTYGVRWYQGEGSARFILRVYRGKELVATKKGLLTQRDKGRNVQLGKISRKQ